MSNLIRRSNTAIALPIALVLLLTAQSVAAQTRGESEIVDVGRNGVCLYGHWLSGPTEIKRDGCNVFIGGYLVYPGLDSNGEGGPFVECEDFRTKRASAAFRHIKEALELGRLYMVFAGSTRNVSKTCQNSVEFQSAIDRATSAKFQITSENWEWTELYPDEAEQLRNPIPIEKCGGY